MHIKWRNLIHKASQDEESRNRSIEHPTIISLQSNRRKGRASFTIDETNIGTAKEHVERTHALKSENHEAEKNAEVQCIKV